MDEQLEVIEEEVEFDETLYHVNLNENDFSQHEEDGIGEDVEGDYE